MPTPSRSKVRSMVGATIGSLGRRSCIQGTKRAKALSPRLGFFLPFLPNKERIVAPFLGDRGERAVAAGEHGVVG